MFRIDMAVQELSREFLDDEVLSEAIMHKDLAEKVDRVENEVSTLTEAIKNIARTLDDAINMGCRHSFRYVDGVEDLDEKTQAVMDSIVANIREDIYGEINDLLYGGSRVED